MISEAEVVDQCHSGKRYHRVVELRRKDNRHEWFLQIRIFDKGRRNKIRVPEEGRGGWLLFSQVCGKFGVGLSGNHG